MVDDGIGVSCWGMESGGQPTIPDEPIWSATVEILVEPDDLSSGRTKGFINVTPWANTEQGVAKKVARYLERYNWHLLGVERIRRFDEGVRYEDEVADMVKGTRANLDAIIPGLSNVRPPLHERPCSWPTVSTSPGGRRVGRRSILAPSRN